VKGKLTTKIIVGVLAIGGALAYFVYTAMQSAAAYYISVDEFAVKKTLAQTHTFRIAGNVGKGTVARDLKEMLLQFDLVGTDVSLPVHYRGVVPENFAEEREVVIEGKLATDGIFHADKLMTRCESKYEQKLQESE